MKIGTKVKKQVMNDVWYGEYISDEGDYSYADDPSKLWFHQYGDCVVKWDVGPNHKNGTYEWESELELD